MCTPRAPLRPLGLLLNTARSTRAAWTGSRPLRALSSRQVSSATQQISRAGDGSSSSPADALSVSPADEADAGSLMEDIPVAPQPIFTRKLSKDELQKLRENIPIQREPLYQPPPLTKKEQIFYPVFKAFGAYSKVAVMSENASAVWRSIEDQATQDAWFDALNVPRSWMSEHALIAMHVWILHRRHMLDFFADGEFSGRLADKYLFDEFWKDTEWRIRTAKNADVSFNRQMELVQKGSFMDMFEYDAGLAIPDDDNMELAGALYRSIFQSRPGIDARLPLLLADWLRAEVWNVLTQPKEDVYRGWITWSPALGDTPAARLEAKKEHFLGEWREHTWIDGSVYFFNTVTHERTEHLADVPKDGFYPRRRWALVNHLKELREQEKLPQAWEEDLARIEAQEEARLQLTGEPGAPMEATAAFAAEQAAAAKALEAAAAAAAQQDATALTAGKSKARAEAEQQPAELAFPPPSRDAGSTAEAEAEYPSGGAAATLKGGDGNSR